MADPKAKTLQMKLGFFDEDLKKPQHDEILKWIDLNAIKIITDLFDLSGWHQSKIDFLKTYCEKTIDLNKKELETKAEELDKRIELATNKILEHQNNTGNHNQIFNANRIKALSDEKNELLDELNKIKEELNNLGDCLQLNELPLRREVKIIRKIWEFPVSSMPSSGYNASKNIIGFIDFMIRFSFTDLTVSGIEFYNRKITGKIEWKETDHEIDYRSGEKNSNEKQVYFEAKTAIPSLGELFRQMRMYKEFIQGQFIIVCPDDSEKSLIIDQGFKFIKYEL